MMTIPIIELCQPTRDTEKCRPEDGHGMQAHSGQHTEIMFFLGDVDRCIDGQVLSEEFPVLLRFDMISGFSRLRHGQVSVCMSMEVRLTQSKSWERVADRYDTGFRIGFIHELERFTPSH